MTLSQRGTLPKMMSHQMKVLVPIVLVSTLVMSCISGCAGFAEPLPQISVSPSSLSMNTAVGSSSSQIATATNVGTSSIGISQATVSGTGFSIVGLRLPATLSPGQSASFTVRFAATASGSVDGSLFLITDAQHRPFMVRLHGAAGPSGPAVSSVTLSPSSASLGTSGKMQFTVTVQGTTADKSVTWKASLGSITSDGLYTAPASAGTATITATSNTDPTISASASVTVTTAPPPPGPVVTSVTVSPASASSITSGTLPFTATVQGTTLDKTVTWKASLGNITAAGTYTAPAKPGTATVTATSNADPTKAASAVVTVTSSPSPAPVINSLSATPTTVHAGQSALLQWSVTGASTLAVSGVGAVSGASVQVSPSSTTTYTLTATNASGSVSQSVTVTVLIAIAGQPFDLGVVTHFGQNKGNVQANLSLIQQMGATSIRDEVHWSSVEHQKGQYAMPASAETFVNASVAKGLKPLLTLDYGNPFYDNGDKPISDAAIEGYAKYAEFVVSQFKGRVSMYEIWNEWDGGVGKTTPGTPDTYVKLLKVVYPRLKAIDPNLVIIGGGVTGGAIRGTWFGQMLAGGALSVSDAISIHQYIYSSHGTPEKLMSNLAAVEDTLRSYHGGQDFPLYLTETGWPTITGGTLPVEAGDFNAETILLTGAMSYLKGIWWYDFQDDGVSASNVEFNFGLVHADLSPKPGFFALTSVTSWTQGAEFTGRITTSDPAVDGGKFLLPNGQEGMAIWRQGAGSSQVQIKGASTMQVLQNSSSPGVISGNLADPLILQLTESPVWITGGTLQVQ
jgi:hypothetical protein